MTMEKVAKLFRVKPGKTVRIGQLPTNGSKFFKDLTDEDLKARARDYIKQNLEELTAAQELLYASDKWAVLVIFQAMDAAGKDGAIKHVMSGWNPQGCQVASFKRPSDEELDHTFLWRYWRHLPERGRLGIFNRSYYEETLVVRVHSKLLERQKLPPGKRGRKFWKKRWEDINAFEHHLARNGTVILKFFLNVSKQEQKQRFLDRLTQPDKHWKFSVADLEERGFWDDYMRAYEETLSVTSTPWAPWFVIPADHKWVARAAVSAIITQAIRSLPLSVPRPGKEQLALLRQAKAKLMRESSA